MTLLEYLRTSSERFARDISEHSKDVETRILELVRRGLDEVREHVSDFFKELAAYSAQHPEPIFAILRRLQPILVHDRFALVTRFEDVQEVLARDDVFDVPYAEKMRLITDGENFFLGMPDGPRYSRDQRNALLMVRREDASERVLPFVEATAHRIVADCGGELEVVTGLTQVVPARLVADYFGTPGPSERELIDWASTLFWFLFLDQADDPALREQALQASARLNAYLDEEIAARARESSDRDDAIARGLAQQSLGIAGTSSLDIRNNLVGLIVGAIPTTATAAALALDELLDRPEALAGAQAAARANDDALFTRYVFEAMRFRPMNPGIFRTCNQDYVLARDDGRATKIPKGATVIAATQSAMFDSLELDAPNEFRIDRSPRQYLLFGYGLHNCFGRHINQVQIPQILKPVLARKNLRRAAGDRGKLALAGPFAGSLVVNFD